MVIVSANSQQRAMVSEGDGGGRTTDIFGRAMQWFTTHGVPKSEFASRTWIEDHGQSGAVSRDAQFIHGDGAGLNRAPQMATGQVTQVQCAVAVADGQQRAVC